MLLKQYVVYVFCRVHFVIKYSTFATKYYESIVKVSERSPIVSLYDIAFLLNKIISIGVKIKKARN